MPRYLISLFLILTACGASGTAAPTKDPNTNPDLPVAVFEGFYLSEPEISSFVPCALGELPGEGVGYWLIPDAEFSQRYENPEGISFGDIASTYGPYDRFAIYVRFEGVLHSGSDVGYGPSGLYIGEIQVTRTLEVSRRWVGSTYPEEVFRGCSQ